VNYAPFYMRIFVGYQGEVARVHGIVGSAEAES
jgi:hypothetical protein